MDEFIKVPVICPQCHTQVRETDYYCFNCGKNLKPAPKSVSVSAQIVLYLKSILLPPFGIWWALPYLKESNQKAKVVGSVAIALTLLSLIIAFKVSVDFMNVLNEEVNKATFTLYGF